MPHDHAHEHTHHGHSHAAHGHHHHHLDAETGDRRVGWAIVVNLLLTVAQIVGGVFSGSVALIADAIHNLSDAMSLVIAYAARRIARRPADAAMTFGYGRAEIVAALVNYVTLIVIALWLASEGIARLFDPPAIEGWAVVALAGLALVIDLATAALTWRLSKESVNIRAAFLHNLADAMTSVAVIVVGTLILLYDWRLLDPLATIGISGFILWHSLREILPVVRILMLGAPPAVGADAVLGRMRQVPGVADVHGLLLWQIDERANALSAHVVLAEDAGDFTAVTTGLQQMLAQEFGLQHVTLAVETAASACTAPPAIGRTAV